MHTDILSPTQKDILLPMAKVLSGTDLYLAGGTALALQIGHRPSIDFDWFTERVGNQERLLHRMKEVGLDFRVIAASFETIYLDINSVQVSVIGYNYPLLSPLILWQEYGLYLASTDDIACMKLSAVTNRGSRKDFIDLYCLIQKFRSLERYLKLFTEKFKQVDIGHVLRSLVYFEDADLEPNVKTNLDITWTDIKKEFETIVKKI